MKASDLARGARTSVHTVRYYQRIGLLAPKKNALNGYHEFSGEDLRATNFIKRAQSVGLRLDEIRVVFERAKHRKAPCPEVRDMVRRRLVEVEERLGELTALRNRMRRALAAWRRMPDGTPDGHEICRLIESLGESSLT